MRLRKADRQQHQQTAAEPQAAPKSLDPAALDGAAVTRLLGGATAWLERSADAVNALNVFPVPDGDTGTNMLLTMRAALEGASRAKTGEAGDVFRAIAQGAVMGARGNSGVILSQVIAGLARGAEGAATLDGARLARAFMEGATTAYRAVTRPVEGTILTVARAAGDGALEVLAYHRSPTGIDVLEAAHVAAQQAVERTPEQLPVLRQAGVVDAGGEGYRLLLEGMLRTLRGEPLDSAAPATITLPDTVAHVQSADAAAIPTEEWGYCTQFIIRGPALDVERMREELQELAASALVVGDEELVRVHGHTDDPGQLLTYAVRYGRLQRISIEDMDAQHDEWLRSQVVVAAGELDHGGGAAPDAGSVDAASESAVPETEVGTVAIVPGDGLKAVFESLGAGAVVPGGQTMNPSAQDILQAARRTRARAVIVLPNNGNVVMTAQQAARVAEVDGAAPRLLVVPSKTIPQGIAAQLAFSGDASPEENVAAMTEAAGAVRTVEVTRATRSVHLDGMNVHAGDMLGLLDDQLVAAGHDPLDTAREALAKAGAATAELITLYSGMDVPAEDADRFAAGLREAFPAATIELVSGGQPHYDYLISVE
jgi:uncharacterized protein